MALTASVAARVWLTFSLAEIGEFTEGNACAQEAVRISDALGERPYSDFHVHWAVGVVQLLQGELESATPALERAVHVPHDSNLLVMASAARVWLGYAYLHSGRTVDSLEALKEATSWQRAVGFNVEVRGLTMLAEARLQNRRTNEAAQAAAQALDLCCRHGQRGDEAYIHHILGEIALGHGSYTDEAAPHYVKALALAEPRGGMRPLVAHCHLGVGKLDVAHVKYARVILLTTWLTRSIEKEVRACPGTWPGK
jgi:hypothetical protein